MQFLKKLCSKEKEFLRRIICLCTGVIPVILMIALMFTPFISYPTGASIVNGKVQPADTALISPINGLSINETMDSVLNGISAIALVLFFVVLALIITVCVIFALNVLKFFRGKDEKKISKSTIVLLTITTVFSGIYMIASLVVPMVSEGLGGVLYSAGGALVPFIIAIIVDVIYAIFRGLVFATHKDELFDENIKNKSEKEKSEKKSKRDDDKRRLSRAKLEFFICTSVLFALTVFTVLSRILTVNFYIADHATTAYNIVGLDFLNKFKLLNAEGQLVAYVLFCMLLLSSTLYFLCITSYLSHSKLFAKLSLCSVVVFLFFTLLVGMFGKYYEIIQKMNDSLIASLLGGIFGVSSSDLASVGYSYTIISDSFFLFLISVLVIGYMIVRRVYSRIAVIESETAIVETSGSQTIEGEVAITNLPEEGLLAGGVASGEEKEPEEILPPKIMFQDPCPAFTELDEKKEEFEQNLAEQREALFNEPTLPKLVQFIVDYARDSRLHLSYTPETIATFIAGLGTTKLTILQGMSGTGKTSLPKIFTEALMSRCEIVEVESSWRDKNELLGYYNEFSKMFTPKKFTQALYRAKLNPETITFIVLDEMNLSRIEYYFSDFLSLMENEPDKRELKLLNVGLFRTEEGEKVAYSGLHEGHTLKIPTNVWFIGTANRDESTFEISDKVYDRANTMNLNKRAPKVNFFHEPIPQRYLPSSMLEELFAKAKEEFKFDIDSYKEISAVEKLLEPYNISFGNRIAMQIENFVSVYCACFSANEDIIHDAVETILLSKVVAKLELKSVENKRALAGEFAKLGFEKCSEFILKLNED